MLFKIGRNPLKSADRPYDYVVVKHAAGSIECDVKYSIGSKYFRDGRQQEVGKVIDKFDGTHALDIKPHILPNPTVFAAIPLAWQKKEFVSFQYIRLPLNPAWLCLQT